MASRKILVVPDRRLRRVARPVDRIDGAIHRLVGEMFAAMYRANGIGLAAIQIGEPLRIVTIDVAERGAPRRPQPFINPLLVWQSEQSIVSQEGCLSVPGHYDHVTRAGTVGVRYHDLNGKPHELEADGLLAICIQHEMDHLDGVLFIDRVPGHERGHTVRAIAPAAPAVRTIEPQCLERQSESDQRSPEARPGE